MSGTTHTNLALGATPSANTTFGGYSVSRVNDGNRSHDLGGTTSWANNGSVPAWVELDFGTATRFGRVDVYATTGYILRNYEVQYYDGSSWITVADAGDNTQLVSTLTFPAVTARRMRIFATEGSIAQPGYTRINEIEVYDNQSLDATASASSTFAGYSPGKTRDASRSTALGGDSSWTNVGSAPAWLELDFGECRAIDRLEFFGTAGYVARDYDIQYWDGSAWQNAVTVNGNANVHNVHDISLLATDKIRFYGRLGSTSQSNYIRVNELEAY